LAEHKSDSGKSATAEVYLTIAVLAQNLDSELVDSSFENTISYRDHALSLDKHYTFGVKIRISKALQEQAGTYGIRAGLSKH
jgi:hypothetical protein